MPNSTSEFTVESPNCFHIHKEGEKPSNYQDAHSYSLPKKRYAVANGTTGGFFSDRWVKLLVERFCQDNNELNVDLFDNRKWKAWLQPIQQKWQGQIKKIAENADPKRDYPIIINRHTGKDPGTATFVGLQLEPSSMKWKAMIIGDSCLFHVQNDKITSYLMTNSQEFDHHPKCFASIDQPNNNYIPTFRDGTFKSGDFFILVTDALAKWILKQYESKNWPHVWHKLSQMTWNNFYNFIEETRKDTKNPLENDDVTLSIIPIGNSTFALT